MLIQTALWQEFQAVASALEPATVASGTAASRVIASGAKADAKWLARGTIARRECVVVRTGVGPRRAASQLASAWARLPRPGLVISFGLAGALVPQVRVGDRLVVRQVQFAEGEPRPLRPALERLAPSFLHSARQASLVTVSEPALAPATKAALAEWWSAELCDMETHAVAAVAAAHGVAWLGARLVSDSADETLKAWIMQLPELVEKRNWPALAGQLGTHPQDLPRLIGLAYRMRNLQRQLSQFIAEFIVNVVEP